MWRFRLDLQIENFLLFLLFLREPRYKKIIAFTVNWVALECVEQSMEQ